MIKLITRAFLALAIVLGLDAAASRPAEAGRGGGGIVAGVAVGTLLGLGIAGAYAGPRYYGGPYDGPRYYGPAQYAPGCYPGPRRCGWAGRQCWRNPYGE